MSTRSPHSRASKAAPGPGRLRSVTPEAFEQWVGERFESLGYAVLGTPFRGDHGIDLSVERQGERAIVQCKHWPSRAVGEPVLRDLFGTLHHVAAHVAYLVTTGNATPAALEWAKDKPIHIWDWQYLVKQWPAEIAEVTASSSSAVASSEIRTGWYVYRDDHNTDWAIRLPASIGGHPSLGFEPAKQTDLPEIGRLRYTRVGPIRPRHLGLTLPNPPRVSRHRSVPVGTREAFSLLLKPSHGPLLLEGKNWQISSIFGESSGGRAARARA